MAKVEVENSQTNANDTVKSLSIGVSEESRVPCLLAWIAALVLASGSLYAYNPAAHVYIADSAHPGIADRVNLRYGAIAPDLAWFVVNSSAWPTAGEDTHGPNTELKPARWSPPQQAFTIGWLSHTAVFGADWVAHVSWKGRERGYVTGKAAILSRLDPTGQVTEDLAHSIVEAAVDLLVKERLDPQIAAKLLSAVVLRSPQEPFLLARAFITENRRTNWWALTNSETEFRGAIYDYAQALSRSTIAHPRPLVQYGRRLAAERFQMQVSVEHVELIFSFALNLCRPDFAEAIRDAVDQVRNPPE